MLLDRLQLPYEEIDVTRDAEKRVWLVQNTGQRTVPQIFIDGRSIGGFRELDALHRAGGLRDMFPESAPLA
jgi:glutaredoxin 3